MAGLIRALFGGRPRPPDPDPLPGQGGYQMPPGPAGQSGFPGSTAQTRTLRGRDPRQAKIRSESNTGWDGGLSSTPDVRQAAYRGDVPGAAVAGPRSTGSTVVARGMLRARRTTAVGEWFGGPMLRTGSGNRTAGGNPLSGAAAAGGHSVRDSETRPTARQPVIGVGTPGAANVRNTVAQRYKAMPGQSHTYQSAARADQATVNPSGQASDGNVHPDRVTEPVSVPSRFVFPGGGNTSWSVLRRMPYTGRGDGARGAQLSGARYYSTGQSDQFWNAGQGDYGVSRQRGGKRPVGFTQPAPWTSQFYDTTDSVGTQVDPNVSPAQAPDLVYISPGGGRASNRTGRTH